jgi:hypothetical protein
MVSIGSCLNVARDGRHDHLLPFTLVAGAADNDGWPKLLARFIREDEADL